MLQRNNGLKINILTLFTSKLLALFSLLHSYIIVIDTTHSYGYIQVQLSNSDILVFCKVSTDSLNPNSKIQYCFINLL